MEVPAQEFALALVSECAMVVPDVVPHVAQVVLVGRCGRQSE